MPNPHETFAQRHIGPGPDEVDKMLATVGAATIDKLIDETVPKSIRNDSLDLDEGISEIDVVDRLRAHAERNQVVTSLIGLGYYNNVTPPVIQRNILENPAWYTAYTPYQPEISQGRLEALLNFQTMVSDLTGLDVANASLLDEPTAAAEAMAMCRRMSKVESNVFLVDPDCHLPTKGVIATRAEAAGIEVRELSEDVDLSDAFGILIQYPGSSGEIRDHRSLVSRFKESGGLVAVATDLLALALLTPPGEFGADIAVGSAQRFGVPLGYGGPHAGFIATTNDLVRGLPGRLVGASKDSGGRIAYRLALQTREQHIRREKATSNVCTAQVLLAVMAGMYGCWHGPDGIRQIAGEVNRLANTLVSALSGFDLRVSNEAWFDTVTIESPGRAEQLVALALEQGLNVGLVNEDLVRVAFDETSSDGTVRALLTAWGVQTREPAQINGIPEELVRTSDFMGHPVFNMYHSEHEMLRYLRRLADRDLALDRSMIPLGSCTMKLNATSEMIPITWPGFADIHPYSPVDQARGYGDLIGELEAQLAEITGYHAVSIQPNAGSQGELAGLLAIRAYHRAGGDASRDICLIPASAHGTNAASAVMAGLRVVVVRTDASGNVDLDNLRDLAAQHAEDLACAMVTYPSTHGVFEEGISTLCEIVHEHGGQVYVDGANLNALVGLAKPAEFGADVSHLNLHKTFTIPHGGGGPGVGPIGVREHLAPYLPNHPLLDEAGPATGIGPISGAPYGSAGILPIPYAYILLMGASGLRQATVTAILSANYVASRLDPYYPVLYTGENGRVAHECILDLRPLTKESGVTAEDVAKRLADYGFHAPTLSFPVAGTLMVEPTESESLAELDRFCEAMIAIHAEAGRISNGEWPRDDNPLRNAPHTARDIAVEEWAHPYTREMAAYPSSDQLRDKYWPPVSRVDGVGGDRNLVCACPPIEAYA